MSQRLELIRVLSDGHFHSGEELGAALGISRVAVWKALRFFPALGLDILAVPGRGYRLAEQLELLSRDLLLTALSPEARPLLSNLDVLLTVDSTNRYVAQMAAQGAVCGYACFAEHQSAGRGRRGRAWASPFGGNVYLSVSWRFNTSPAALAGLSLAVGVAVIRALRSAGVSDIGLKWPNDILWQGRKLAGVLIELTGESAGPCDVVVGVGLNVRMPRNAGIEIDQPWADVYSIIGARISRNWLAGLVLQDLLLALNAFEQYGLEVFRDEWTRWDLTQDKEVELRLHDRIISGRAAGVDNSGALLLVDGDTVQAYSAGEVTLRLCQ